MNDYGDEEVVSFSQQLTAAIPLSRFRFVNLVQNQNNLAIPCFPGDTSVYDFQGTGLRFHVNNRSLKPFDTAFFAQAWRWNNLYHRRIDSLTRLLLGDQKMGNLYVVNKKVAGFAAIHKKLFETDSLLFTRQSVQLDSLLKANAISEVFYRAYQSHLAAQYIDMVLTRFNQTNDKTYLNKIDKDRFLTDTYLQYDATGLYKNCIRHFVDNKIGKNNYHRYNAHELTQDYSKLYDSCDLYLSSKLLTLARYICLQQIKKYQPGQVFQMYYNKFLQQTTDTVFKKYVTRKFEPEMLNTSNDNLATYDNKTLSLDQLLKQHKGKKIYLDLWASWCLPCIRSLQEGKKQLQAVDPSRSVILYISLDDDATAWRQTSQRLGLAIGKASYRLTNPKESHFLQQIKLKDIPRYVYIDANGNIANPDAPSPESSGFASLLDRLPTQSPTPSVHP